MKRLFVINRLTATIISLLASIHLYSQSSSPTMQTMNLGAGTNMKTTFNLGDAMRTSADFKTENNPHIKGSAFYDPAFSPSQITLKSGAVYTGIATKINLFTNDIYYLSSDSTQLVAGKGAIKKVILYQNKHSKPDSVIFSCGYPSINHNDENTIYEVLVSGEASLVKLTMKFLTDDQTLTATPEDKKFVENTDYYVAISKKNIIEKWKKGKDFITGILNDKGSAIQKFIDDQNLKCKSLEDTERVIEYYNQL